MATKALTDSVVKTIKPERGATAWREISDAGCRGLRLRLSPSGEKVWAVKVTVGTQRVRHTIGAYPAISLSEARKRAEAYLASARDGASPDELDARQRAETMTFAVAHAEYIEAMRPALRASTISLKEAMVRDHVNAPLGKRLIRTIRRADLVDVVGSVAAKGFTVQANRVFSEVMAMLRWCEQKGYLDGVPSARKKDVRAAAGAKRENARRRILTEAEIAATWNLTASLGDLTGDFLRLLILTGQRRDEVRLMLWSEVDMEAAMWVIPKERYKTGSQTDMDHSVPLSPQVMSILRRRWKSGAAGYVLAGRGAGKPFNGAAGAMLRLRKALGAKADFTLHDFRRTLRTGLSRLGIDEATAEMVIGHVPQGIVAVYDQHDRMDERRAALVRWAEHVERLAQGGNVVSMARKV
ncbi:MAG TPA: integrase arm-type DNA-binding domain-containing protein [Patescibacteria group bacterium]|nr:integrase arm-type DNA-binding domain-containing protein [Patescibacteria group bacterium]